MFNWPTLAALPNYSLGTIGILILVAVLAHSFSKPAVLRDGQALRRAPNALPVFGHGLHFIKPRHSLFSWFIECERTLGYETVQISVPTLPAGVIIHDPRNVEFVLKNEGIFSKGNFVKSRSWDLFGHGIINVDGALWRAQRKAGLSFLNKSNLKTLTHTMLPRFLNQGVSDLRRSAATGELVDMQAVFLEVTTQLMGRMAYNMEMHADDSFTVAFEYASEATARRFQNPFWQVSELVFGHYLKECLASVKDKGRSIVSSAMRDRSEGKATMDKHDGDGVSGTLIQALLDSIENTDVVADAALNFLSAGRDTTAQALSWALYLLVKHPEELSRLRRDIQLLIEKDGLEGRTTDPSLFTPSKLPYGLAIFYEALRLYPPVPLEIKQVQKATCLPDKTVLPPGVVLLWCSWSMNRSKETWGDDADLFRPSRWIVEGKVAYKSVGEFSVFNGGPRTCLGKQMAELIGVQVLSTMVRAFDFHLADSQDRVSRSSLTLPILGGLPCYIKPTDL